MILGFHHLRQKLKNSSHILKNSPLLNIGGQFATFMRKKDKKLKVLILTHVYSDVVSGGETKAAWEITNALARRGVRIYIVTLFTKMRDKPDSNIKIYRVPFSSQTRTFDKLGMFKTFFYALPIIFLKRINVIHLINTQGPHPFAYFKIRPFVSTVDLQWNYDDIRFKEELLYDRSQKREEFSLPEKEYGFLGKVLGRFSFWFFRIFKFNELLPKSVDLCAYRHAILLGRLKKEGYKCKFVHIPVGVDVDKFSPKVKPILNKKDDFVFLLSGTISKRKGVEYLIKAFNLLSKKYRDIKLILIGPGAPLAIDLFKKKVKPYAKVRFVGQLSSEEIVRYFNYADIFVSPMIGLDMGMNKSVVEAMSCGKPIIVNRAHDTEMFDREIGFCVESGRVKPLAEAMEKFIKNPSLAIKMGEKARKFAVENHSWSILAERLEKAYLRITS